VAKLKTRKSQKIEIPSPKEDLLEKLRGNMDNTNYSGHTCSTCVSPHCDLIDQLFREGYGAWKVARALQEVMKLDIKPTTLQNHYRMRHHERSK